MLEDEPLLLESVHRALSPGGYSVRAAGSAEEAAALFAASPADVVISDTDGLSFLGRVRELSPHTQRILATGDADLKRIEEASLEGTVDRYLHKPWDDAALRMVVRSAVAQQRLERQLVQTAQLTVAGQLAAGVAHDINNPLASILAFSQLMRDEPGRSESDLEALRLVAAAATRGKQIVEALLRFVRRSTPEDRGLVDLNSICDDAAALVRPQAKGRSATLSVEHPREQTWAFGNANLLSQVCVNLLQNAIHAVGARGNVLLACAAAGDQVALSVKDDGPGIPADVRPRIFEPFFTTSAEGTGLGLSIVHRIVEHHGGAIRVDSEAGRGATFTVLLPALEP
jgi:signal transduction histidine kinase